MEKPHQICKDLVERGFCAFLLTQDEAAVLDKLLQAGKNFFTLETSQKRQFNVNNFRRGYFTDRNVREFLRVLPADAASLPFSDEFLSAYRDAYQILHNISLRALDFILESTQDGNSSSDPGFLHELRKMCEIRGKTHSVVSLIHYLPITYDDISTEESEQEYLKNWGSTPARSNFHENEAPIKPDHYAHCRIHEDSNLFSLILCSDVPGLQVWDNSANDFLEVERESTAGLDLFCVLGRKLTNLVSSLVPTTHRVVLPYNIERYSLVFFVDI